MKQALILHHVSAATTYSTGLETFIKNFANSLMIHGCSSTAWNLVKLVQNGSAEMQELQWTCFNVAGGRDCTGDQPPFNPYNIGQPIQQQQVITQPNRQYPSQHPPVLPPSVFMIVEKF
uniref:N-acetylmuramoyl-L-alanine amidase n=1 Tax=Caenorhabditis tropicalis TaxID=1561998 RepID=A0A1I7UCZ3_9PELO